MAGFLFVFLFVAKCHTAVSLWPDNNRQQYTNNQNAHLSRSINNFRNGTAVPLFNTANFAIQLNFGAIDTIPRDFWYWMLSPALIWPMKRRNGNDDTITSFLEMHIGNFVGFCFRHSLLLARFDFVLTLALCVYFACLYLSALILFVSVITFHLEREMQKLWI